MTLRDRVSNELLPRVRGPAQYIGGELNQLVKPGDWQAAEVRVVVGFPDAYTIGMSHLGCQILYWLCNQTPGVVAERTYCPMPDAEAVMRERQIPLFTWDTRQPAGEADIFAISLQYELCFSNVLTLLDLAGIPLKSCDRTDAHPLVIIGGPQADNPEPMADFVDLVVIGDGEQSLAAILEAVREYKRAAVPRRNMILLLARRFPWIYAPNLYDITYHADGTIAGMLPKHDGLPTRIDRCQTPDFDAAAFPEKPLVPWVEVVHDRISIEIMRGCPQVCRFCHAGYTKRPLNYRSVERILEIAEKAYWATGQHEIGLLSLSTADYPLLRDLAARANEQFESRKVGLSFPSLRVDKMLQNIPWMGNAVRKGSITMAVEAARDDMRRAIRKKVTDGNLLDGVREVYKAGWKRVKLYFMSGFPGERPTDIDGIYECAAAVSIERAATGKPPGDVNASVGWLVPKPFTPFQWMAQPRVEYFEQVRRDLRRLSLRGPGARVVHGGMGGYGAPERGRGVEGPADSGNGLEGDGVTERRRDEVEPGVRGPSTPPPLDPLAPRPVDPPARRRGPKPSVRITTHDPRRSILEGVFARGDRRLGAVVLAAWRHGARLDAWDETYRHDAWQRAFTDTGVDPDWYAHRERSFDEILPWDHIGLHMRRGFLEESYEDVFRTIGGTRPGARSRALPVLG